MIITREKILAEVQFEPVLDVFQVNPHSIDLRLATALVLPHGVCIIGTSMEKVSLPDDIMVVVFPRSSTNRRGISLMMTGPVDAGYSGSLVLPLMNMKVETVTLKKGERVASLIFYRLEQPAGSRPSKYHNGDGTYVPDKEEETSFLASGDIEGLKAKYRA